MNTRKAALHNLGCKVNACETQAMRELLSEAGYEIVPFDEPADVYVVNTCTVTQIADRKSRQMLHRAKALNPAAVIVASGCYVESAKREQKPDDAVDIWLGNNEKSTLIQKIEDFRKNRRTIYSKSDIASMHEFEALDLHDTGSRVRTFLKIEDGCNRFCSYCLIPFVRGRVRSLPEADVVESVRRLAESGCREIVLDGIHLTSYGTDFIRTDSHTPQADLLSLLEKLDRIDGIERIRLGSLEPDYITAETAHGLSGVSKLCPHFHLSLQSGSNQVLKRMNRRYTTEEFREKCNLLRHYFHDPALTTDVITGFPGESEAAFTQTCSFLEEISFYQIHVFPYSPRKGTKAAEMPDQIPGEIKKQRRDELLKLTKKQQRAFENARIGQPADILIEECKTYDGMLYGAGHTPDYLYVSADGKPGEIVSGILSRDTADDRLKIISLH